MTKERPPTYSVPLPDSEARLRELVLYISQRCESDKYYGKTKLNKVLVFADFTSFARRGVPVTGVEYMRQPQGPVPRRMLPILKEMEASGEILVRPVQLGTRVQQRVIALRKPNLSLFTSDEIAAVEQSIQHCWKHTAKSVSDLTHGIAWRIAGSAGELIPYEAVFLSDDPVNQVDIERTRELNARYGWEA